MAPAIHTLSAAELSSAYAKGKLSPVEVTEACLARISAWEPRINAMYLVQADAALAAARAAEARWKKGQPFSALDGVPITLKENLGTQGDRSPIGTKANESDAPKPEDSPPAARVRGAGCIILGKTTMPDFGMLSSGLSSLHGVTRNPWRLDRNTSGSSSGAAAAAVAGYAPLHLGTDIGGSVRLPATHCGIFALKPTLGRLPTYPPYLGRITGPMTRSVQDSALLMNVTTRPDWRDFMSLPPESVDYAAAVAAVEPSVNGMKIGLLTNMNVGLKPHSEIVAAAEAAAKALEQAGASVHVMRSYLTEGMADGVNRFFEARSYNDYMSLPAERQAKVLPFIVEWTTHRAKDFTGRDVMSAYNQIVALREASVFACQPYDYVLSPTSPILPYEAELPAPGNDPHNAMPHIAFTAPYNMSEQPASSVPWTTSKDGLPIGVQVIGRRFDDLGVLKLSRVLEMLRPALPSWPEPA
jgi:aspartyl-tRNA(Asn)/glutamyl-tRNA(Gln) amidotransferase subunit A